MSSEIPVSKQSSENVAGRTSTDPMVYLAFSNTLCDLFSSAWNRWMSLVRGTCDGASGTSRKFTVKCT